MRNQYGIKERESLELVNTLISRIRNDRNGGNRLDNGNINNKVGVQGATGTKEQVRGKRGRADEGRSERNSSKNSLDNIAYSRTIEVYNTVNLKYRTTEWVVAERSVEYNS